jgi:hypothetical protein
VGIRRCRVGLCASASPASAIAPLVTAAGWGARSSAPPNEVMQVANFVRSNWGNRAPQVTLNDVSGLRPKSH